MSTQMLRIMIAGALLVHGVGHTLGLWMPARSWLLPFLGEPALRVISNILWVVTALGFLVVFLSFLGLGVPGDWWRPLAIVFAIVSLVGLFVFWGTWPAFNTVGALSMNIAVLLTQLWLQWPPVSLFGR